MKQLKSSLSDLRAIFERSITVRDLAEPLVSFDETHEAAEVRSFMESRGFDVIGVRHNGLVAGYAEESELKTGNLEDCIKRGFDGKPLLEESATVLDSFHALRDNEQVYVLVMGQVWGIITRGDLQKTPTRMWLFGVISLVEMQLLRIIRMHFNDSSWQELLTGNRLSIAKRVFEDRQRRNEEIDLADCLQFSDKAKIVSREEKLREKLGFSTRTKFKQELEKLRKLRDDLAHSNDIITNRWPELADLANIAEQILERAESYGLEVDS